MKIKTIRTYHLRSALKEPFGFSQWYYDQRNVLLIEIVSDTGISGWGECYGPADVTQSAVENFYAKMLIGMDPISTEKIWQQMWRSSLDFARGGIMMGAMSGLDIALWDLKGKALNRSVSDLIGGANRSLIPCYATGMYYQQGVEESQLMPVLIEEAKGYADDGFEAMKIKVGKNIAFDKSFIRELRNALPDTELMADANHAFDYREALAVGRVLEECNYAWFEEPLSPEAYDQFKLLHDKLDVPIATGECEQTRFGFNKLIATQGVDLIQADLAYCGGISEALKIRAIASANCLNVIPHVWGTMLNLAAATHFMATAYHEPGRFEPSKLFLEYDRTENPLRDDLFSIEIKVEHGQAKVPTAPGLGVEVNFDKLQKYLVKATETHEYSKL